MGTAETRGGRGENPSLAALRAAVNEAAATREERLRSLERLAASLAPAGDASGEVNNHVHTIYSFSPYTPAMAALRGREAGLEVVGSVDHDSISAAREMTAACALLGLGSVTGCELRVELKAEAQATGPFAERKINNPDSPGLVYMTIQGVPADRIDQLDAFLEPIRGRRIERTRQMAESASALLVDAGFKAIDFEADILVRSMAREGGGVTERHLLAAVADRLISRFGRGRDLVEGIARSLGILAPAKQAASLADPGNPYLEYDILGLLKAGFIDRIFVQPGPEECIPASRAVAFALSIGAIPAYAYLGDVGESPTGDKKAEKFEDEFLGPLFVELRRLGYLAVTYMPPRNSRLQLERVRALCEEYGFMQISGVDINQPRQSFNCPELRESEFHHLVDSTWALVAHERLSSIDPALGLFSAANPLKGLDLGGRCALYARAGRGIDQRRPGSAADMAGAVLEGRYTR